MRKAMQLIPPFSLSASKMQLFLLQSSINPSKVYNWHSRSFLFSGGRICGTQHEADEDARRTQRKPKFHQSCSVWKSIYGFDIAGRYIHTSRMNGLGEITNAGGERSPSPGLVSHLRCVATSEPVIAPWYVCLMFWRISQFTVSSN